MSGKSVEGKIYQMRVYRLISGLLVLGLILSVAGVAYVWSTVGDSLTRNGLRIEVFKALLQLAVVVILGGAVASLLRMIEGVRLENQVNIEKSREESRKRTELYSRYMQRVGTVFRRVKSSRRVLRSAGLTAYYKNPPQKLSAVHAETYAQEMQRLNLAQLELEELRIEASNLPEFLALSELSSHLRTMENYLREILREYEFIGPRIAAMEDVLFSELARLDEFTASTSSLAYENLGSKVEGRFKSSFAIPHDKVINAITRVLI